MIDARILMRKSWFRIIALILAIIITVTICPDSAKAAGKKISFKNEYGVFLSIGPDQMDRFKNYKILVIDVQNDFTKKDISKLKKQGHIVYSYINVGAIENYRDYYTDFEDITLDVYENWPDEKWVDVSQKKWQEFILNKLAKNIIDMGVDGFFVDNTDVYYNYNRDDIYDGLTRILKGLKKKGKVIINGGDTYVSAYLKKNKNLKAILDGVNQESVFSRIIDYENDTFGESEKEDLEYFQEYLAKVKKNKKKVYLLEYTKDKKMKKKIKKYCKKKGYSYYISDSIDLS